MRDVSFIFLFLLLLLLQCCNSISQNKIEEIVPVIDDSINLIALEDLASFEKNNIKSPGLIKSNNEDRILVWDYSTKRFNLFNDNGDLLRVFGKEGRGPEDFIGPYKIVDINNSWNIVDLNLLRVTKYSYEGTYIGQYNYKTGFYSPYIALLMDSVYISISAGSGDSLLKIIDLGSSTTTYFGETKRTFIDEFDNYEFKQFENGEIPEGLINMSRIIADQEYIYVYLEMFSELRKYTASGSLLWERKLVFPANQKIINQALHVSEVYGMLGQISFIQEFHVVDNEVYFLTFPDKEIPQLLVKISADGELANTYTFPVVKDMPAFKSFTVSPSNQIIYLSSYFNNRVQRFKFPN